MQRPILTLAAVLLLYQAVYWLYLLRVSEYFVWQGFPYALFHLSFFTHHSVWMRLLLLLILLHTHFHTLLAWRQQGPKLLIGFLLLSLLFLGFDRCFGLYTAPYAFPVLLAAILFLPPYAPPKPTFAVNNPQARSQSDQAIALPTHTGYLPINNPQRGIYILGNQGSGKTHFVLEPLLYHMIQQGYAGLIYDYDFEGTPQNPHKSYCLSKFAYNCWKKFSPQGLTFHTINFTDLARTRRVNPFANISNRAYLEEYVSVLLKNLVPGAQAGQDFWLSSAQALLKSLFVFLDNCHTQYCTLPHALALAAQPIQTVLSTLRTDEEAAAYASSVLDALDAGEKGAGQLSGITATLKVSLQNLLHPAIFWVLSGDDLPLRVNDRYAPMLLCIGNYPPAKAAFSPLIALLITLCFKAMYGHGKVKSFVAIDELPTLFLPDLSELPATARKYGISTIACLQSNAQLAHTYGAVGAEKLQQTLVSKFIGNTEDRSAVYGSELIGKRDKEIWGASHSASVNQSGSTEGRSHSMHPQERLLLPPQAFMRFSPGEFAGKVAQGDPPFFHTRLRAVSSYDATFRNECLHDLPLGPSVDEAAMAANYQRIWQEAKSIVAG